MRTFFRDFTHKGGAITVEYSFRTYDGASIVAAWSNTPGFPAIEINLNVDEREAFEARLSETHIQEPDD